MDRPPYVSVSVWSITSSGRYFFAHLLEINVKLVWRIPSGGMEEVQPWHGSGTTNFNVGITFMRDFMPSIPSNIRPGLLHASRGREGGRASTFAWNLRFSNPPLALYSPPSLPPFPRAAKLLRIKLYTQITSTPTLSHFTGKAATPLTVLHPLPARSHPPPLDGLEIFHHRVNFYDGLNTIVSSNLLFFLCPWDYAPSIDNPPKFFKRKRGSV